MIHPVGWITACAVVLGFLCLLHPLALKIRRRDQSPQPYGIHVVSDPPNAKSEIVAVHGLGAHPEYTWIRRVNAQKANTTPQEVHLLRDLLPETFPEARILSFADNTSWLIDAPVKTARDVGKDLLDQLKKHRASQRGPRLPICFIGHSFGGIIIKEALCMLAITDEIVQDTSGILFLGTPHQGSSLSLIGSFAAWLTSFLGSSADLPLSLRQDSPELRNLAGTFESRFKERRDVKIYSICETLPTKVFGISVGLVVTHNSAKYPGSHVVLVNADHSGLNKCYGWKDQAYVKITGAIIDMRRLSLLDRADKDIRNSYDMENLKIERLSSQRLPMEQCYINLVLVEQNQPQDPRQDSTQPPALYPTLLERMDIKESSSEKQFDLQTLFQPRKIDREEEIRSPKRILIRGRPGVGKTTLCKKIVHDFVYDRQWNEHFKRLFWIPLRNLPQRNPPYTIKNLIRDEFFAQSSDRNSESKLEELFRQCNSPDYNDSLFLLDGLDEIWHGLSTDSDLYKFVQHLLNRPNVIVTTRPSVQFSGRTNEFDLELETVGFFSAQVKEYVRNVEPYNASSILDFLDEQPLVADLVRIPIQLDALCFAWRDKSAIKRDGLIRPETMTELYQAIERGIWKKDAVALGKIKQQQTPFWTELELMLEEEIFLLEKLAFTGMHNKITIFDSGVIRKLLQHLPSPKLMIDSTLQTLSLLRASGVSPFDMDRSYYFLHLTLQEYFAARYIKRQWAKGDKGTLDVLDLESEICETLQPATFFHRHKYNEYYDIVWRFLAGLLNSDTESQVRFFNAIQSQPLDVLGPAHQRLVMRCLFETRHNFSLRRPLEDQLSAWLDFEYELYQQSSGKKLVYRSLSGAMEFPVDVLEQRMSSDENFGHYLLQSIKPRRGVSTSFVEAVIMHLRKWSDMEVLLAALSFFKSFSDGELPKAWMQEVVARLEHSNTIIRLTAMEILRKQSSLPMGTLQAVVEKLEDRNRHVRQVAAEVLGNQPDISGAVLQAVVDKILNKDHDAQESAIQVFRYQPSLSVSLLSLIIHKLASNNSRVRDAAIKVLQNQPSLSVSLLSNIVLKLESDYYFVSEAASRVLQEQPSLPKGVLERIILRVKGGTFYRTGEPALEVLRKQPSLEESLLCILVDMLKNENPIIQRSSVSIFQKQPSLPEAVLKTIIQMLEGGNPYTVCAAIRALEKRLDLSETLLEGVIQRLEDQNANVRACAIELLQNQPSLPEAVLEIAAHLLRDKDSEVRQAATYLLKKQSDLPVAVSELVTRFLKDESCQSHALTIFENQPSLPKAVLKLAIHWLKHEEAQVRRDAIGLLENKSNLSEEVLEIVARLLEDEDEESDVRCAAAKLFRKQRSLPKAVLNIATRLLENEDEDKNVRAFAMPLLRNQSNVSKAVLKAVAEFLADMKQDIYVQKDAYGLLLNQLNLPEDVLLMVLQILAKEPDAFGSYAEDFLSNQSSLSLAVLHKLVHIPHQQAISFLKTQPSLPEAILVRLAQRVYDSANYWDYSEIFEVFKEQTHLSEAGLQAIANMLESQNSSLYSFALDVLEKRSLPTTVLETVAKRLPLICLSYSDQRLLWMLMGNPELIRISQSVGTFRALFKYLLRQSCNVHCAWYHDGQTHFLTSGGVIVDLSDLVPTCVINQMVQYFSVPTVAMAL